MEKNNKLVENSKLTTKFLPPLEIKNYMTILGATIIDNNTFILDGLLCEIDSDYESVYFQVEFLDIYHIYLKIMDLKNLFMGNILKI